MFLCVLWEGGLIAYSGCFLIKACSSDLFQPPPPPPLSVSSHMFETVAHGRAPMVEKEGEASLVTSRFPPACHRAPFPWEFIEPCSNVQVTTFTICDG